MEDFGVIVIVSKNDLLFAKGCCASIKYFMPDVPICLLVDGDFPLEGLDTTYQAIVLRRKEIQNDFLRKESYGWGITRMIAFWESPFAKFLLIDADTNLWGDLRQHADLDRYDLIIDHPKYGYSEADLELYFFDKKMMRAHFPHFDLHNHPYVCPAVLMSRRNVFDLDEYKHLLRFTKQHPDKFKCGDMGFINYLFFNGQAKGQFQLGAADFQYLVCDFDPSQTRQDFAFVDERPVVKLAPTVMHWTGTAKPTHHNAFGYYTQPMIFFREQFYRDTTQLTPAQITQKIQQEDKAWEMRVKWSNYRKVLLQKISRLTSR
jgi:lipopolysaccharide biosynthesis glycosyltransferase